MERGVGMPNMYKEVFGKELPGRKYWNKKIETMSLEEADRLHEKLLRAEIQYVFKHSLFYHRKFREAILTPNDVKTLKNLEKLPFTTKDELRKSLNQSPPFGLHVTAPKEKIIRIHTSSGTTGKPTLACITKHDKEVWTEMNSRYLWASGVRPRDTMAFGLSLPLFVAGLPLKDACEEIGAAFLPTSTGMTDRLVRLIQLTNANVLASTPSYTFYLAEHVRTKLGVEPSTLGVRKIIAGAEPGVGEPTVRARIQTDWNALAFEGMGNADAAPRIWGECPWQNGMHFFGQGIVITELIDPDSGEVIEFTEGSKGELVYTTINREASPVVRFRTGDNIICWTEPCECGRTSVRIRCFGRTDDMLKVKGIKFWPSALQDIIASFYPRVTCYFQVVLPKERTFFTVSDLSVDVEHGIGVRDEELQVLEREIVDACVTNLFVRPTIRLLPPGTLPRFEMKARLVKRE